MYQVPSLKSLSLKIVADIVWEGLKIKPTPFEPTLGIKLTNLVHGLDGCRFHASFLNCLRMVAILFQHVFSAKILTNSLWNNFKFRSFNFEGTLKEINDYLVLPNSVKLELAHVLSTQYESYNLFQMLLMLEMGFHCLDLQDYFHLNGSLKLLNCLNFGKKNLKKLVLRQCLYNCSACNKFSSLQTQDYLISSFPRLQELNANGTSCNDYTLRIISRQCPFLKKLKIKNSNCISDRGIAYLCSPESVAKQLIFLSVGNTLVSVRGAERAMRRLPKLEKLECSNHTDVVDLILRLSEQKLVFNNFKELSLMLTEETQKLLQTKQLVDRIPTIFPNLVHISVETEVSIDPSCLLFTQLLPHLRNLELTLNYIDISLCLFPCDRFYTNPPPLMPNLTHLCLSLIDDVCIHAILSVAPCLEYLTIQDVIDSGCQHMQGFVNHSVRHLALIGTGESVLEKCLGLCTNTKTLAIVDYDEMQFRINNESMSNLTHLSLDCLHQETAAFLVQHCKNLKVLNIINQLPGSEEALWFQKQRPMVKVMYFDIEYEATWYRDERFSPCSLCEAYESHI